MKAFFRFFASRHKLSMLLMIMILLIGFKVGLSLKRESWPAIDLGQMNIRTIYPGASSEDVELNVTNKIEDELKKVIGIEKMTSFSMENLSLIKINLNPDAKESEQFRIKNDIREAVGRVSDLPSEINESPLVQDIKTSMFGVIEVGIAGDLAYKELRLIAKNLQKHLEPITGVANIERYGFRAREVKIAVSNDKTKNYQISLPDIIQAINLRNIRSSGGSFESYTSEKKVVTLAQFKEPSQVGDVIVKSTFEGPQIKLSDLAIIKDDFEEPRFMSRMNGVNAISLSVIKNEDADIISVVKNVKKVVKQFEQSLPQNIKIVYANDQSKSVISRFNIVFSNGIVGFFLVFLMLAMALNIRTAFWVAIGIPTTLLGVIALMPLFGACLDSMTLSAMIIVLGIIVDDAIIISENIQNRMEMGDSPLDAATNGTYEVALPVLTTVLTTFCAFAPMFLMGGIMGKYVYLIPLVVSLALFISLGESLFLLPAHLIHGIKKSTAQFKKSKTNIWYESVRDWFARTIYHLLRFRYVCVIAFIIIFFLSLAIAKKMNYVLVPESGADRFTINAELPAGSSLDFTSEKIKEIETIVSQIPKTEMASFITRIGRGFFLQEQGENFALVDVTLTPFGSRDKTAAEIVEIIRKQTDNLSGFKTLNFSIIAGGPPVGKPISLQILGDDNNQRRSVTDKIENYLKQVKGVKDVARDDKLGKEEVEIVLDYEQLSRLGLSVANVTQTVRIAYDGQVVTSVRYGDEKVEFRVLLAKEEREKETDLPELLIPNNQGRLIPLKEVASLKAAPGPSILPHYEGERSTTIEADIEQGVTTPLKVIWGIYKNVKISDTPGVRFVVSGEAKESLESMKELALTFLMAGLAIYFVLVLLFNSFLQPLLVLVAIPFGLIGVIFAFVSHGISMSFMGTMGIIGLAGVVVNDSLVLVDHLNELQKQKSAETILKIISQGTANRLRAVILTSLTTIAGLLPLAYGIGGSDVFMGPMAMALGYGILCATPLTLILVPCLYAINHDFSIFIRKLSWAWFHPKTASTKLGKFLKSLILALLILLAIFIIIKVTYHPVPKINTAQTSSLITTHKSF